MPRAATRAARLIGCLATCAIVVVSVPPIRAQRGQASAPAGPSAALPNYDLAAQWTTQKVSKLVFDTSVTPRWLDTGDRFWYSFQTREGRRQQDAVLRVRHGDGASDPPRGSAEC